MDLTNAKLGEVYKIFLDDKFAIVQPRAAGFGQYTGYKHLWHATVIQIDTEENAVMLGWCAEDGMAPTGAKDLTSWHNIPVHPKIKCLPTWTKYRMGQWVPMSLTMHSCIKAIVAEIPTCTECGDRNPYAEPTTVPYRCGLCKGRERALTGA
jgi:hypothetical protein